MFHDAVEPLITSITKQCKDKGHISRPQEQPQSNPHPQGGGGEGVKMGTLHWGGGGGGGACQTWIIYVHICTYYDNNEFIIYIYI